MRLVCLALIVAFYSCRVPIKQTPEKFAFDDGRSGTGPALAVIGDSLSSGVLASTTLGEVPDRMLFNRFSRFIFGAYHDLEHIQGEFSELAHSATATDQSWGIRAQIAKRHGLETKDIPLYFSAQWGGRLLHVDKYLKHLETNYEARGKAAEYVVFLIGGNDYCRDIKEDIFDKQYDLKLNKILALHPQSTVMVTLLPQLTDIVKYNHIYSSVNSCEKFRMRYCKPIFEAYGPQRVVHYNESIIRAVNKYRRVFKGKIILPSQFESMILEKDDLSFDCFHLSLKGQKKVGEMYEEAFWSQIN
ncbi:MAG: SGNH/GDSL hydrolase family protein [Deltaproteobacteria bacterium]|nr:SGNH/GDSL hydrolase family protein [Deltaproteobacteria bacterium]